MMMMLSLSSFSFSSFVVTVLAVVLAVAVLLPKNEYSCQAFSPTYAHRRPSSSSIVVLQRGARGIDSCSSSRKTVSSLLVSSSSSGTTTKDNPMKNSNDKEKLLFVDATTTNKKHDEVSNYYGKTLQSSNDLATNACCTSVKPPGYIQNCIDNVHPTVLSKYYGCGLCLPTYDMTGLHVLDLGCGAGRDAYIASQLVGRKGRVVGVDMTPEQLDVARRYESYHTDKFGFDTSNVDFYHGYLEHLNDIPDLEENSFDVIISNCVLNLCQDKAAVLRNCYKLLKDGGEMYFSDVYANRRIPPTLQDDPVLWGECLSGALYWNDFESMAKSVGFTDPRLVEDDVITVQNKDVQRTIASTRGGAELEFYSATYRLWKITSESSTTSSHPYDTLEPHCEDYGQAVVYRGTLSNYPSGWLLDAHHYFETGRVVPVCGNTWNMLAKTCLKDHFDFVGNFDTHYGIFEGCGTSISYASASSSSAGGKGDSTKGSCC